MIEQPTQLHLIRKFERRVLEHPSGQYEAGNAAESSVRLDEHFNALVPTQVSDEHDGPVGARGGLVEDEIVGNEVGNDPIRAPSGQFGADGDCQN